MPPAPFWHPGGMNQILKVGALLGVFFLGCAAEHFVVPPAHAGTSPQTWEYSCKSESGDDDVTKMANEFGAQGWEMVAADHQGNGKPVWCFKRPR